MIDKLELECKIYSCIYTFESGRDESPSNCVLSESFGVAITEISSFIANLNFAD